MIDPIRTLRAELLADPGVAAITTRIRRGDPAPATDSDAGDIRSAGAFVAFVVLVRTDGDRDLGAPLVTVTVGARCYGRTRQEAVDLWGAISDAENDRGPRIVDGVLIHRSYAATDGGDVTDPDTDQPYVVGQVALHASTVAAA